MMVYHLDIDKRTVLIGSIAVVTILLVFFIVGYASGLIDGYESVKGLLAYSGGRDAETSAPGETSANASDNLSSSDTAT